MRSHAKASSAGSTQRRAQGLGRFFRGALATRAASSDARGSGASARRLIGAVSALALFLALVPSLASASTTRLPLGFSPITGSGTGVTLHLPSGIAVDETSGNVFLNDGGEEGNVVDIFGAEGGVPAGVASPYQLTEFSFFFEPSGVAVDNSATSPSKGTLYVVDVLQSQVEKFIYNGGTELYEAAGELTPTEGPGFGEPLGAAVDSEGNVFVADYASSSVIEFSPTGVQLARFSTGVTVGRPSSLALDSDGSLFVQGYGEGKVYKYPANGSGEIDPEVFTEVVGSGATGIAVDPAANQLFVAIGNRVTQYDAGTLAKQLEFGDGVLGATTRVAVNSASGRIYVSDAGNVNVAVFGPEVVIPSVSTGEAEEVTTTTAKMRGTVNPEGEQLIDCHFEFVPASQFAVDQYQSLAPDQQVPCDPAAASIPADSSAHAVSADLSGLSPDVTYHFRLVVAGAASTVKGSDRTFTTAIGPPLISEQSVEAVGTAEATLSAKINPKGAKTTYHLEYGPSASYGTSTPESAPIGFPSDDSDHTVSVHIGGLAPGTPYHFRFVATSPAGSAQGSDVSFATYPSSSGGASCPNEEFRGGAGGRLPDCRAYEQATPIDKHGSNAQGTLGLVQASSSGDRVTFYTNGGLPTSGGSSNLEAFMASRGAEGWSFDGLLPPTEPGTSAGVAAWSEDLSAVLGQLPATTGKSIYLRDSASGAYQVVVPGLPLSSQVSYAGFAADSSHLIFETHAQLIPSAPGGKNNLYELDNGALRLASRIPAGSATSCDDAAGPACVAAPNGAFAGPYNWRSGIVQIHLSLDEFGGAEGEYYTQNTISRDGSRVFFTAAGAGRLYVREDGATTTQVSASQRAIPDPNGEKPAAFVAAAADGSKVFFLSCEKLTDDSTAFSTASQSCIEVDSDVQGQQGQDLYSYDVDTGELTDLTVDSNAGDPQGAAVQGVLGASDDGSYVYFVANGVLAPGASPGNCAIESHRELGRTCNLYVSHDGVTTFIASLAASSFGDEHDWTGRFPVLSQKTSRVAADGSAVLFSSLRSLTGYDNTEANAAACNDPTKAGEPCEELFRYSAPDDDLTCVSCNPTGVRPSGRARLGTGNRLQLSSVDFTFLTRNLSADGNQVFFESPDALLPTDTNGVLDVYEWEAEGSGSCNTAGGCIYLLSGGTGPEPSYFADASANGDHVFFFSGQQLVPGDRDQLVDIYDAGVGAGLAAQHPLAPPTCSSTACQANAAPPPEQSAASATFSGAANAGKRPAARKCPKGKRRVRRGGKVRCQKQSKQSKRHTNRGGSK